MGGAAHEESAVITHQGDDAAGPGLHLVEKLLEERQRHADHDEAAKAAIRIVHPACQRDVVALIHLAPDALADERPTIRVSGVVVKISPLGIVHAARIHHEGLDDRISLAVYDAHLVHRRQGFREGGHQPVETRPCIRPKSLGLDAFHQAGDDRIGRLERRFRLFGRRPRGGGANDVCVLDVCTVDVPKLPAFGPDQRCADAGNQAKRAVPQHLLQRGRPDHRRGRNPVAG